jgi:uncharacterized damage-inducible protein DinB
MILPFLLGVQVLLNPIVTPLNTLNITDQKSNETAIIQLSANLEDDYTIMMQRYVAYNHWANQQFAAWLGTASEEDLNREIESSFSSLKETIFHIWNAEYLWLQTVKNESADNLPSGNFEGSKEELLEGWLQASKHFSEYVKTMTAEDFRAKRPRSKGNGYTTIGDMVHHCMNHSTYHRGQIITMGRQAGLEDPPRTDFIYYVSLMNEK